MDGQTLRFIHIDGQVGRHWYKQKGSPRGVHARGRLCVSKCSGVIQAISYPNHQMRYHPNLHGHPNHLAGHHDPDQSNMYHCLDSSGWNDYPY